MIFITERLILRPWEEKDAKDLFEYAKDPLVGPAAGWPPHKTIDESLSIIRKFMKKECYAVCLKEDNKAIGSIELILSGSSRISAQKNECELGFCLGSKYWGRGIIPEAAREMIRYAFEGLDMQAIWCAYYEGNKKSKRTQSKIGFVFHHKEKDVQASQLGETRCATFNIITREMWEKGLPPLERTEIVKLSDRKDLSVRAAKWFSSKWGIPFEAYLESIQESFNNVVPSWYIYLNNGKIRAGMGVIENDFHERKDLTPNVCAVYTEIKYRNRGIAGQLLDYVCKDMKKQGISTLYLLTDHDRFYEQYGWTYFCPVLGEGEEIPSRMYMHEEKYEIC